MVKTEVQRKSRAIYTLAMGKSIKFITLVVYKQEEPYEGRLSRTVPWERGSEILSRDPIMGKCKKTDINE